MCEHCGSKDKEYTAYLRIHGSIDRIAKDAPYCMRYGKFLIAPKIARQTWFEWSCNEMLMPVRANKVCEHFKEKTTWEI